MTLAAAIAVSVAAAKPSGDIPDLIRTHRLEVVDNANTVVARIADRVTDEIPGGMIDVFGGDGKKRAGIAVVRDIGVVTVSSSEFSASVAPSEITLQEQYHDALIKAKDGAEAAEIFRNHIRLKIGIHQPHGGGYVRVHNPLGAVVAEMQSGKSNAGLIMAKDVNGTTIEALSGD